jgi:hypothetical protein
MQYLFNGPTIGSDKIAQFNAAVMRTLEHWTASVPGLDEKGWRLIIEEEYTDPELAEKKGLIWKLDISPATGCGNECAEAKIATLRAHPEIASTGELRDSALSNEQNLAGLSPYVHWLGGVQLELDDVTPGAGEDFETCSTRLLVAFSGSKEHNDAMIVMAVIRAINDTFSKMHPDTYTHYKWDRLAGDPTLGFYLNLLMKQ